MARRRMILVKMIAAVTMVAGAPLFGQATNSASSAPTSTPAPAGNSVGPPQLRDFDLKGTVTQAPIPAPTPAPTPAPSGATATPSPNARTAPSGNPGPAATRAAPGRAPSTTLPVPTPVEPRQPTLAAPDTDPSPAAVTVDLPPASTTTVIPDAAFAPVPLILPADGIPADPAGSATAWWPWLAAALALALGAAFLVSRRKRSGEARYASDAADLGAIIASPVPAPMPRAAIPAAVPASVPKPRQVEPARPAPSFPAARQPPVSAPPALPPQSAPSPRPAPVPAVQPDTGGIVASGLKPRIEFELVPIRAETDADGGAAVTFDIVVINRGSAPARDVLVEAQLINAGPRVDEEVGQFFMQPAGSGERVPAIPPMGRVSIRSRLSVGAETLSPLVVEGRSLFVPLVAINALYRWSGGELKDSSSFLVGRGDGDGGKMAPFRLDRGARSWSGLAARLHSTGLKAR